MDSGQNMFYDFIMERTQDDKKEAMAEFLEETLKPPGDSSGDPETTKKNNEFILTMIKPEVVTEVQKMMNPFDDSEPLDEELLNKNWLAQPNKLKWTDTTNEISKEDLRNASACAKAADDMKCDCWHTGCVYYGDCRKCTVFHTCLKQFPTCQRHLLGDLEEHYILFSRDITK